MLEQQFTQRCVQATAAADARRSTLGHVEAALEAREAELHEVWEAIRQHTSELQSGAQLTAEMLQPDPRLLVSCHNSPGKPTPVAPAADASQTFTYLSTFVLLTLFMSCYNKPFMAILSFGAVSLLNICRCCLCEAGCALHLYARNTCFPICASVFANTVADQVGQLPLQKSTVHLIITCMAVIWGCQYEHARNHAYCYQSSSTHAGEGRTRKAFSAGHAP